VLKVIRATLTVVAILAVVLPRGVGGARAQTVQPRPSLAASVAQARQLSNEIDSLGQQIDGLRIELSQARDEARIAQRIATRDCAAVSADRNAVAALAAQRYMELGSNPSLDLLMSGNPDSFLSEQAAVMELENNAALRYTTLRDTQLAAERASTTAQQQIAQATRLQAEMNSRIASVRQEMNAINSTAMAQAMAIFKQTGQYPVFTLPQADNVETTALRYALSRRGDPYIWGAAGPHEFDCSGLVVWAFQQEGVPLPHYTGSLWDSGVHVSRTDLRPGDLVFFFADISHVGMYVGNGLMVDAPTYGQPVQVQPIDWGAYVGAVRIP
jgi:peptidoglycan DL-endopeptidase CwlO